MTTRLPRWAPLALALTLTATLAGAQALPTSQPKLLQIYQEQIKIGHDADHAATEAGWPAAFGQAKSPDYYLAMASVTGPSQVWFVSPLDSYAAWGKSMERDQADPTLSAALARLSKADAEHLNGLRVVEALSRPDLSHGAYPDLSRVRFWEISTYRVGAGREASFAAAAKAYASASGRLAPKAAWRVYQVTAGLPAGTFIIFSSVQSFAEFDGMAADGERVMKGATPEEQAAFQKFFAEGVVSVETNRFRLDPRMSYVSAETKAVDPAFWK